MMNDSEMASPHEESMRPLRPARVNGTKPGSKAAAKELDVENRDPRNINFEVKTRFEDVIGEPAGAQSNEKVYRMAYRSYHVGRDWCFLLLTTLCSVPLAFCWGCTYACMSFCQIWSMTPCLRLFNQCFSCWGSLYSTIAHCLLDPCYEAISLVFTKIHLHHIKSDKGYQDKKMTELNEVKEEKLPRL